MAEKLGEVLVRKGLISAAQLEEVLKAQLIYGGRLGTNLVELGYLQLKDLAAALGEQRRFPVATPEEMEAASERVTSLLKAAQAGKLMAYPLMLDGRRLKVAMASPYEPKELDELGFITGLRIVPVIAPELLIQRYLEKRYGIVYKQRFIRLSPEDAKSVRMSNVPPPGAPAPAGAEGGATLPGLTVVAEPARPRDVGMFGSLQPGQYLADDEHEVAPASAPPRPVAPPAPAVGATPPGGRPLAPPAVPLPPARPLVGQGGPASVPVLLPPRPSGALPAAPASVPAPVDLAVPARPPVVTPGGVTASAPPPMPLPAPAPASASVGQGAASPVAAAAKPAATVTPATPAPLPVLEVLPLPAPPGAPEGLFGSWGDAIAGLGAPAPAPAAAAPAPAVPAPVAPASSAAPTPVAPAPAVVAPAPPVASAASEVAKAPSHAAAPAASEPAPPLMLKAAPEAAAPSAAKPEAPVAPPAIERPAAAPVPAQVSPPASDKPAALPVPTQVAPPQATVEVQSAPAQAPVPPAPIELPKAEPGKLELASAWEFVRWESGSGGGEGKPLTASWSGRGLELDTSAAPVEGGHGSHGELVQGSHWDFLAMHAPEAAKETPPAAAGLAEANWGDVLSPATAWSATPAQPPVAAEKRPAPAVESAPVAPVQAAPAAEEAPAAPAPKAEVPAPEQSTAPSEPMTLKAAEAVLREAKTPGAVGRALMSWCEGRFHRAFLLSSSLGVARVIRSGGRGAGDTSMAMSLRVDLEAPSLLLVAAEQGKVLMSRQPDGLQDEVLFSALAESLGYLLVAPLRVRKSTPGYLVVAGASAFTEPELEEVEQLLAVASEAIERLQGQERG